VLGLSEAQISSRVSQAQGDLETALLVVLAARTGDPKCPEASDFGRRFDEIDGKGVAHWLQSASRHVERCAICGDAVRNRRPLRLFEELPHSFMPPGVRSRVLEALRDPAGSAFAEQIAERAGRFDEAGFPTGGGAKVPSSRKWILPAVVVGAVACGAGVFMWMNGGSSPASAADTVTTTSASASVLDTTSASSAASMSASDSTSASASASSSPMAQQSSSAPAQQQTTCMTKPTTTPVKIQTSVPVSTFTLVPTTPDSGDPTVTPVKTVTYKPTTITSNSPTTYQSCN